jgi:hypothetical protein
MSRFSLFRCHWIVLNVFKRLINHYKCAQTLYLVNYCIFGTRFLSKLPTLNIFQRFLLWNYCIIIQSFQADKSTLILSTAITVKVIKKRQFLLNCPYAFLLLWTFIVFKMWNLSDFLVFIYFSNFIQIIKTYIFTKKIIMQVL